MSVAPQVCPVNPKGDISQGGDLARGDATISVLPRSQQLRRVPHHRLPSMLEYRERLGDFGNHLFRAFRIDDDNVSRAADSKAVVGEIEQPRRAIREHAETLAQPLGTIDL